MRARRPASWAYISGAAKSDHGMTLIEIMVAALILLVVMAAIVPFFLTGLSQASTVRYKSVASNLAREKMEQIRQLDYREIYTDANRAIDPTLGPKTLESLFGTAAVVRDSAFDISYQVSVAPYEEGYLKEVTVNVTWDAPPRVSAAQLTTMVHQQFLGPRGSLLTIEPTYLDPRGTPFHLLSNSTPTKVRYYIAQADWTLVYDHLDTTPVARDVFMQLALFDEYGQSIPLGDAGDEYKIGTANLHYATDAGGQIASVWFEYDFDATDIPDGYWELRAIAHNVYGEPGNVWRLMVRVEKGMPAAPTDFAAAPQSDNETVVLTWTPGLERDRARYILQRRLWDGAAWLPWVTLSSNINPVFSTYTDKGNIAQAKDPWGDVSTQHYYEYQIWAEDNSNPAVAGPATAVTVVLPPLTTSTTIATTSSTTPTSSTTTTTVATSSSVQIKNISNENYNVFVQDSAGIQVWSGSVHKNKTVTVSGLAGGSYLITATASGKPTITQSFTVPAQADTIVLTIL
jgi:prepilin-type N-terminal cleavage/methylation domain-containing protein